MSATARYAYSPVRHLAGSLWLNRDPARCWMAMWTAVYDASGSESDKTLRPMAVAALLSPVPRWTRLEKEWAAVLADPQFNVSHLHMKDFTSFRGPFASGWRGDEAKRAAFLQRLIRVLKRNVNKAWVMYLPLQVYEAVNAKYTIREGVGGAYALSARLCWEMVTTWMQAHNPGQPLLNIFEAGDAGQPAFQAVCRANDMHPIIYPKHDAATGTWFRPFEAVDFVAYEYTTEFARADEAARRWPPRKPLLALSRHLPYQARHATVPALTALCEHSPHIFQPRT